MPRVWETELVFEPMEEASKISSGNGTTSIKEQGMNVSGE